MTTCYLAVEDEITGAIARIRGVPDGQAVLVLPAGSPISTSRINFRLLAREATERGLDVLVVSDEPGVRALAISAGLPAYDSVTAAEAALTQFARQDDRLAQRGGGGRAPAAPTGDTADSGRARPPETTQVMRSPGDASAASLASTASAPPDRTRVLNGAPEMRPQGPSRQRRDHARPAHEAAAIAAPAAGVDSRAAVPDASSPTGRRRRRLPILPLLALGLLALLVGVGAYAAYMFVPTATISLRPHVERIGPTELTVRADPGVAVADPADNVIPAQRLEVPLAVSGTFAASGSEVTQERATGTVRFRSENTLFEVPIPAGTRVSTESGVAFETTRAATLERASFDTGPSTAQVPVEAVRAGPRGNVDADAITRVPRSLAAALVSVRNPRPTAGGQREEVPVVTQADYDAAWQSLLSRLPGELEQRLADPELAPRGLTVYPESARTGQASPNTPADGLVGQPVARFSLTAAATATVLAVNEALIDEVVNQRLMADVPSGASVHPDGPTIERSTGTVVGDSISYTVSAALATYRLPDREALVEQVRGLSVSEAEGIMGRYGAVEITTWPEFVDRIPDQASRINLTLLSPQESQ